MSAADGPVIVAVMGHRIVLLAIVVTATLAAAAPALASLRDEVRDGQTLAQRLQAGETNCERLSVDELEHLGEYVMGRMAGSLQLHASMNERMRSFMGAAGESRMHVLIGRRYGGCASNGSVGSIMGPGMMSFRGWSWMRDGNWRHMSRADWRRASERLGPGMMRPDDNGWGTREVLLVGTAALLAAGLLGALLVWAPWRRRGGDAVTH